MDLTDLAKGRTGYTSLGGGGCALNMQFDDSSSDDDDDDDDDDEDDISLKTIKRPTKQGIKFVATGQQKSSLGLPSQKSNADTLGMIGRQQTKPVALPGDIGAWQKHTKGIGLKLLQKFGFTGRLGAKEDGIVRPVEVVSSAPGEGLGFTEVRKRKHDFEPDKTSKSVDHGIRAEKIDRIVISEGLVQTQSWKKGKTNQLVPKPLDVTDFLGRADRSGGEVILDMRGQEVRVLQSLSDIAALDDTCSSSNATVIPKLGQELLYNINLFGDLLEVDVANDSSSYAIESKRASSCILEIAALENELTRELPKLERLENLGKALEKIETKQKNDPTAITLEAVSKALSTLYEAFTQEFQLFGVINLLPQLIAPVVQATLTGWDPMLDPSRMAEIIAELSPLVKYFEIRTQGGLVQSMIETSIESHAVPVIRRSISNAWDPIYPDNCIILVSALQNVLPQRAFDSMYESLIKPKLEVAISSWRGSAPNSIPFHVWLHPWLPLFGIARLSLLFPDIRRKMTQCLKSNELSDDAAIVMIKPWLQVFDSSSIQNLFVRSIIPRLVEKLRKVNFSNDQFDIFAGVMKWHMIVPSLYFVLLLEGEFFPEWLNFLARLLNVREYAEVGAWYLFWKTRMPHELMASEPRVRASICAALDLMVLALDNGALKFSKATSFEEIFKQHLVNEST